jgi:hypothetical protein
MALYAPIDCASSGQNEIVPAKGNESIIVVSYVLVAVSAVTAKWEGYTALGGVATEEMSGAMSLITGTPLSPVGTLQDPLMVVKEGLDLSLLLGSGVQVSGHIAYYYSGDA